MPVALVRILRSHNSVRSPKVLVIEDSADARRLMVGILRRAGFEPLAAESGVKGIALAREYLPDLIVSDIAMPETDGYEVLETLRSDGATAAIPFIFVTALGSRQNQRQGMEMGADDYLTKPVSAKELLSAVRVRLERQRVEMEIRRLNLELATRIGELEETREKLVRAERMAALGRIGAGVAHELNNPVMGILNGIEYALSKLSADGKLYEVLADTLGHTRRCARIVENLLSFTRQRYRAGDGDVDAAVRSALGRVEAERDMGRIRLTQRLAEHLPRAALDPYGLQQVVVNLLANACDAMSEEARGELLVESRKDGQTLRLAIGDSGCGMDEEVMRQVFEPFYTTKPAGAGSGLGLFLCKNIVESVGGHIEVVSEPGRGATFTVVLPVEACADEAPDKVSPGDELAPSDDRVTVPV